MGRPFADRALVVGPKTVATAWRRELAMEDLELCVLEGPSKKKLATLASSTSRWHYVNYEGLRACPALCDAGWDAVVLDESTRIKNPRAAVTKTIRKRLGRVPVRLVLSGMPAPESPQDVVEQMLFVAGDRGFMRAKNYWEWRARHMEATAFSWQVRPTSRPKLDEAVREEAFVLTCAEAGVFVPRVRERIDVELAPREAKVYRALEETWQLPTKSTRTSLTAVLWARMLAAGVPPEVVAGDRKVRAADVGPRHREVARVVAEDLRNDSVVVWYNFKAEGFLLREALRKARVKSEDVGLADDRGAVIERFREGRTRVLTCQLESGRFGVDLSRGTAMIFASNALGFETRTQAERRMDAVGRDRPVLLLDVVAPGTIDEGIESALADKACDASEFMRRVMADVKSRGGKTR